MNQPITIKDTTSHPAPSGISAHQTITVKDTNANPAPLGLLAFGMTTVLLNLHNAGFFPLNSMILAMGIFYGGSAQVIAGIMEFKKNNTFGTTAFTSYGMFWLTLVGIFIMPHLGFGPAAVAPDHFALGCYLAMWGLFTACMFVGTLKINRALQVIFGSLTILFFLLAIENFTGIKALGKVAGIEGIFCGLSAIYAAIAQVLNDVYAKEVLPLG